MGPRTGLDIVAKIISREWNMNLPTVQPVANLYTDWAIAAEITLQGM
jgi:hypothetical protein